MCSNPVAKQALSALQWYNKSYQYQTLGRTQALEEMMMYRMWSKWIAYGSTAVFSICVAFLMSYLVWRLLRTPDEEAGLHLISAEKIGSDQLRQWIQTKMLATRHLVISFFVGQFYFVALAFILTLSSRSIQTTVEEFKNEYGEPTVSVADVSAPKSPRDVYDFISQVSEDIRTIPEAFMLKSALVPTEARWWTLGWDQLYLVDLQVEAMKALLKRGQVGVDGTETLIPLVNEHCKTGQLEI